jgi:hypothetical protein
MTAIRELLGKPPEAPAAVPTSVHEHEPRHRASIHHSKLGHILKANPKGSGGIGRELGRRSGVTRGALEEHAVPHQIFVAKLLGVIASPRLDPLG